MNKPKVSIISCISRNRGIGKDNQLLFKIPADLKRFKAITMGHPVIMGLKTYESIGRPLPGRLNIVLAKDETKIAGVTVCQSIEEAIAIASDDNNNEIFFIGGGSVYAQVINLADKLYLTIVDEEAEADTFFPDYLGFDIITESQTFDENNLKYKFVELEKHA